MALYCLKNCMSLIHISQIFSHKMISHLHMLFLGFSVNLLCPLIF